MGDRARVFHHKGDQLAQNADECLVHLFVLTDDFHGLIWSRVTLDTSATFTLSNMTAGQSVSIIVTQDGTGTRTGAFSGVKFPSGVVNSLSTGANDIDIVNIFYDGTNYYGSVLRDFV